MTTNSKFAFLPVFICLFMTVSAFGLIYLTATSPQAGMLLPTFYLLFVIYFWLTEFRTRAHRLKILDTKILKREYFGFGKEKVFEIKDLEGFYISMQPGRNGSYEYIFILQDGKRIASISKFYHRNYNEIKSLAEKRIKNLGSKEYKFINEYKEMFK